MSDKTLALVYEYRLKRPITILNELFLEGDTIYIQSYDPVSGREQKVFNSKKEYLGWISSDRYWEINDYLEKVTEK